MFIYWIPSLEKHSLLISGAKVRKKQKQKFTAVILFFFEGNKTHLLLNMNFDKVVTVGKSNNARVWGRNFQLPEANEGRATLRQFFIIFPKKYTFLSILFYKFLFKTRFK